MAKIRRRFRLGAGVFAVSLALGAGIVPSAGAATKSSDFVASTSADAAPPGIPATASPTRVEAWFVNALRLRIVKLGNLTNTVVRTKGLDTNTRTAVDALLTTASAGMDGLLMKAPSDTTIAELRPDIAAMITNFHVLNVVIPQVKSTVRLDLELAAAETLLSLAPGLRVAISTEQQSGGHIGRALTAYQDLETQLNQVTTIDTNAISVLEAVAATSYSTALQTLKSAARAESLGAADLTEARADSALIVKLLGRG